MARPRRPEGALASVSIRLPAHVLDRATQIAATYGLSRSAWLARVITRAVAAFPEDDD